MIALVFCGCHPSVNFVDSSPLWEPYGKPLLEERWHEVTEWWLFGDVPYSHYPL